MSARRDGSGFGEGGQLANLLVAACGQSETSRALRRRQVAPMSHLSASTASDATKIRSRRATSETRRARRVALVEEEALIEDREDRAQGHAGHWPRAGPSSLGGPGGVLRNQLLQSNERASTARLDEERVVERLDQSRAQGPRDSRCANRTRSGTSNSASSAGVTALNSDAVDEASRMLLRARTRPALRAGSGAEPASP